MTHSFETDSDLSVQRRTVRIVIGHQLALVMPDHVRPLLETELAYVATEFLAGGDVGYRRRRRRVMLVVPDGHGGLQVPSGLVPLVVDRLTQAGFTITTEDRRRFGPCLTACARALALAHPERQELLQFVADQPRALLEARDMTDTARQIAALCQVFPAARVLIPWNTSRRKMQDLHKELSAVSGMPVHVVDDYPWPYQSGRMVCLLRYFQVHHGGFDLVIFPDALQALTPCYDQAFGELTHERVFGFVRPGLHFRQSTTLRLLTRFGPIHRATNPRAPWAKVRVAWTQPPPVDFIGKVSALERKRRASWHNGARNDWISAIARACVERDEQSLWSRGLFLEASGMASLPSRPTVCIIVQATEHGRELLARLPGWELVTAVPGAESSEPRPVDPFARPPDREIITHSAAHALCLNVDVVIWASAEWSPDLPGLPPLRHATSGDMVLVDLADDFDALARAAVRRRHRDYQSRGWTSARPPRWVLEEEDAVSEATAGPAKQVVWRK